ncbi:terminase large subunit [Bacillus infantis]|uniref:Terminase large subunit n=1 Tax=Bacillus infantis TaxID=324767 RepID=A0A5D4RG55_9BACI|nr:terminase TerL endonuclease subunit [Bacillus infantis]TYS50453.1 terminase large subunit [Bacillus infantis]
MDRVTSYAWDVCMGKIPAGDTQKQACNRHLQDLERQDTEDFPYVWDSEKANEIIEFAETLTIAEGEEEQPLSLYGFQDFIFGSWHGWRTLDGYRRFRTSYVQVARQNGKSLGNAVPTMYYGNFDGYNYPQIYCTATKELQARIVLKECFKFINADPELCGSKYEEGLYTIKDYASKILCNLSQGEIRALGRDTKSIDGFRPYFASVDEYHLHKDNQMYKLLADGTKKLKQCLISVITTAGFDLNSPCYALYEYCKKILAGVVKDETQFVFICELNKDDDIWDETNWIKANPLWTEQTLNSLKAEAIKAKAMGGEDLRNFLTKSLNQWVKFADNQYMNLEHWKNSESNKTLEDFKGFSCYAGLDLSSGGDLTSLALIFPYVENYVRKYFIHSHSFIPAKRVAEHIKSDKAPYDMWIKDGLLTPTETLGGIKTDYKYIIAYLAKQIAEYSLEVKMIGYDPHNASAFLNDLEELGIDSVSITQSARNLNDATEDFRLEVAAGNVEYNKKNELLIWSVTNAKTVSNSFGEIKLDKDLQQKRIDPVDAIIDAWKLAMSSAEGSMDVSEFASDDFLKKLWG